ncbi:hypothetical protein ACFWTE_09350 [Nocardiopsis sp. NPDC058631]|uniref:hypothetical protein n=1 Tax=Nocardiopsis sp. NPDC058631 TaxID=3346566 RepID=UPI00364BC6A4
MRMQQVDIGEIDCLEGLGEKALYEGEPFTGEAIICENGISVGLRTFIEGRGGGPRLRWSPSGKLVAQGNYQFSVGPVGSWHEWDEEGSLLSEAIYDALGNLIIFRERDGFGNIGKEEVYPPVRLLRDPGTGEGRPAPWL